MQWACQISSPCCSCKALPPQAFFSLPLELTWPVGSQDATARFGICSLSFAQGHPNILVGWVLCPCCKSLQAVLGRRFNHSILAQDWPNFYLFFSFFYGNSKRLLVMFNPSTTKSVGTVLQWHNDYFKLLGLGLNPCLLQIFKEEWGLERVGRAPCTTCKIRSIVRYREPSKLAPSHVISKEKSQIK